MDDIVEGFTDRVHALTNKTVTTPVGIGKTLQLSPNSMEKVSKYSSRGIWQSRNLTDATPTRKRSGFLVNVVNCFKPIIRKICEIPKFIDGNSDATGVCALILTAMRKEQVFNPKKRKLFDETATPPSPQATTPVTKKVKFCKNPEATPPAPQATTPVTKKVKFCKKQKKVKFCNIKRKAETSKAEVISS